MILGAGFYGSGIWSGRMGEDMCSIVVSRTQYNQDSDGNKVGHRTNLYWKMSNWKPNFEHNIGEKSVKALTSSFPHSPAPQSPLPLPIIHQQGHILAFFLSFFLPSDQWFRGFISLEENKWEVIQHWTEAILHELCLTFFQLHSLNLWPLLYNPYYQLFTV